MFVYILYIPFKRMEEELDWNLSTINLSCGMIHTLDEVNIILWHNPNPNPNLSDCKNNTF